MLGSDVRLLNICLLSKKTNKYHLKTDALKWQSVECTHRAYAETPWGAPGPGWSPLPLDLPASEDSSRCTYISDKNR